MKSTYYKWLGLLSLGLLSFSSLQAEESTAYWLSISSPKTTIGAAKVGLSTEWRSTEFDRLDYYFMKGAISWKLNDQWSLGTSPVWERSRSGDSWSDTYRLDLELNPAKFKLWEDGPTVGLRNRWELRWKEGKGSYIYHRLRQYHTLSWKIQNSFITEYTIGNEIFYELDRDKFTMDRFYPVILKLKSNDYFTPSVYYMYQYKRSGSSSDWNGTHVFGLKLQL